MARRLIHIFFIAWLLFQYNESKGEIAIDSAINGTVRGSVVSNGGVPDEFIVEVLTKGGLDLTAIAFAPNGTVFIADQGGRIWAWDESQVFLELQLDLSDEVYENGRRGLESMVVDESGRLFILYAVSDVSDTEDAGAFGRIARYDLDRNTYSILENTRTIIVGESFSDGIPACSAVHGLGEMQMGRDGSLLVATSDAANHNQFDSGGIHGSCFGDGRFKSDEDIGAYRAQSLESLAGKVLRIDPSTGNGLSSNPYYSGTGSRVEAKIWSYGFREPAGLIPLSDSGSSNHPGMLLVADRGWNVLEELNINTAAGANYGWPCMDGLLPADDYPEAPLGNVYCTGMIEDESPAYWWHHQNSAFSNPFGLAGTRFGGMTLNEGERYPSVYEGRLFYSDRSRGWLATALLNQDGELQDQRVFSIQLGSVDVIHFNPYDQFVYFIDQRSGSLARLRHADEANVVLLDRNPREIESVGKGFYGEYFDDTDFTGDSVVRLDTLLAYDVFEGPEGDIYNAARWEGYIIPDQSEVYTFHVSYLDKVRFWLNEELLIDDQRGEEGEDKVVRVFASLKAGVPYRIKAEQALEDTEVRIGLAWNSVSQPIESLSEENVFYGLREGVNLCLAEGARPSLSTTLSAFAVAENACDGDTDGDFFSGSVAASESQSLPYWQVDLGSQRDINAISLWGRTDCCEDALNGAFVFVSNSPFQEDGLGVLSQPGVSAYIASPVQDAFFSVPVFRTARYIRVQLPTESSLFLAEVEIRAGVGNIDGAPPASGLVSWWNFEDQGKDRRGGNDGVFLNGAGTVEDGERQFVLELDGGNDVMEVPHSDRLNGTRELTYALWVYPESWSEGAVLMSKANGDQGQMWLGVEENLLVGKVEAEGGVRSVQSVLPAPGTWTHIALVYAGNQLMLYVDGQEKDRELFGFGALVLNQLPLYIGEEMNGRIDDAVLYDVAIEESQLQELVGALSNVSLEEAQVYPERFNSFSLKPAYPNPFRDRVQVHYELSAQHVLQIEIFDSLGRRVRSYQPVYKNQGDHLFVWDGRDDVGRPLRAGGYFIRMVANDTVITTHLIKL